MSPQLPPPDPHEPTGLPAEIEIPAPTAILLGAAAASEAADRVSDWLLSLRPGLLIVLGRD